MRSADRWIAHTYDVLDGLKETLDHVREAELFERSFILTHDSVYLVRYHQVVSSLEPDLKRLYALTADNPREHRRVATMDSLVQQRRMLFEHRIATFQHHGTDSAVALIRRGDGLRLMTRLSTVGAEAISDEERLLVERSSRQEGDLWESVVLIVVGLLGVTYLVATGNIRLLRHLRARARAEDEAVQQREEAEAANQSKSDFLARMSHELRTPLNSVIGFANVMLKNKDGHLTESDVTYLNRIQSNGRHLLSLINQILDVAKIESGRIELLIEPVDIAALVREVVAQFEPQAREMSLRLAAEVPDDLAPFNTDNEKLRQVLINLIGNAMKFTTRGGVTVVVEARHGTIVSIAVRDTGIGIPKDRLNEVFEAFEQAENTTSRKFGGTGLGLSISKSLAQLLGLELVVDSEVGVGTTFTLWFPARSLPLTPPSGIRTNNIAGEVDYHALRDCLVLIVDDDADSRTLLGQHLEELGCRVMAATNGEQGLRIANRFSPDAILLDLRMPGMNGWEVLHRLQQDPALHHTPTVLVSVVASEHPDRAAPNVALLDKPCTRDQLASAMTRVLRYGARSESATTDE